MPPDPLVNPDAPPPPEDFPMLAEARVEVHVRFSADLGIEFEEAP